MQRYSWWPAFLTLLALSPVWAQNTCNPSALGQPCAQGGIALQAGSEPSLNLGAGNPIHLVTGNKYQQEYDLPANPRLPQIEITRHYNALDQRISVLGQGWSLAYDTRLFHVAGRWQIVQADGSRIMFAGIQNRPVGNRHGTLAAEGTQWLWTWPSGKKLRFNKTGRLVQIVDRSAAHDTLDIKRNMQAGALFGTIAEIVNGQGASLAFDYQILHDRAYIQSITSPAGRFQYLYEPATDPADPGPPPKALRLKALVRPDGMQRRYLYEPEHQAGNRYALTGIEIVSADQHHSMRTNTWAYDASGKAILSIQGDPKSMHDKVAIQYIKTPVGDHEGLTVATNAQGQSTHFHTAIRGASHVLLRVTGAACPGCAAPSSQAGYDTQGRLASMNGTTINRNGAGQIQRLNPSDSGWPGLELNYQENGLRTSWKSTLTGLERTIYNSAGLPLRRAFANGDRWDYKYDPAGRPVSVTHQNTDETQETTLSWQAKQLVRVEHPHETETRQYDEHQRLRQRNITRTSVTQLSRLQYTERFDYDAHHRLIRHYLPEGGSLTYRWGRRNQLLAIDWHDRQGKIHPIIRSTPERAGYDYGNGLRLQVAMRQRQAAELTVSSGSTMIWSQQQNYDAQGRLQQENHQVPPARHARIWRYAYDADGRLSGAQEVVASTPPASGSLSASQAPPATIPPESSRPFWYAWNNDGSSAALRVQDLTLKPTASRDSSGLPTLVQGFTLRYGANRRLTGVARGAEQLDTYRHNAFGQRITKQTPRMHTDYFYLDNRVVAEARRPAKEAAGLSGPLITRRYIYAHHSLVGLIDYAQNSYVQRVNGHDKFPENTAPAGAVYAVHSDLLGAPRLITDAQQNIRWLATYSPTGAATRLKGDLTLSLRLPGQVFDQTTGWHDNLLRTYVPQFGHYLESDPLGPIPANQALGYAGQQPKRYVDPLGLLLFAFDSTRNGPENQSNVWKMSQRYQDGPVFYHAGPGNPYLLDWDAVTAYNAPAIIETQWQLLLNELDKPRLRNDVIPIDIIGFSRGAALARHFGNQINRYVNNGLFSYADGSRGLITACIDLRFMGLFDTVAQFGLAGSQNSNYDLSIAAAWDWVAHAVALQERRWLFPLSSAADSLSNNTIEAPFIGAHADIGGGMAYDEQGNSNDRGDLSDVALNWMLWQARAASLRFGTGDPDQSIITQAIVHDQRSTIARSVQNGDRHIDAADGSLLYNYQDDHARLGRAQRDITERIIQRYDNWRRNDSTEVGTVDMQGYAQWLQNELGLQALPA